MAENIFVEQARWLIEKNAKVIDIREKADYKKDHIDGSINIDINDLEIVRSIYPDRSECIIVVCASGIRSMAAVEKLRDMGYVRVYNLVGGYNEFSKLH